MDDFGLSSGNKTKLVHRRISEDSVRIVSKSAKGFRAEKPRKKWILVAHSIGDRMHGNNTSALGEVLTAFGGVESRRFPM